MTDVAPAHYQADVRSGAVWWTRLLMLIIFGQQFQGRPSTQSYGLLTCFAALLSSGVYRKAQQEARSSKFSNLSASQLGLHDGTIWMQCIACAGLFVYFIHRRPVMIRFCCLGLSWVLLGVILQTHPPTFLAALPFHEFNLKVATTVLLLVYSGLYHAKRGFNDRDTYVECATWLVRRGRELRTTMSHRARRPIDLDISLRRQFSVRPRNISSPSLPDTDLKYSQLDTGVEYERLEGDQLRLLQIVDASSQTMRCTLKHYAMKKADSKYTALSYHWGKDLQKRKMIVNEKLVDVPTNMYLALEETHRQGFELLWVDAICINQQDLHEKSAQLLRMGSIFRKAKQVVAWLGTEDPASKTIMSVLSSDKTSQPTTFPPTEVRYTSDDVRSFVDRPYWRRVWIIQELANASHVVFACCEEQVLLDRVRDMIDDMLNRESTMTSEDWPQFVGNLQLIKEILEIRDRRYSEQTLGLLEALVKTCTSEASVRHDKVFGLLGIANDQDDFMRDGPDYEMDADEMSMSMTRSFLVTRKSLDLILAGPRKMMTSSLPSWCPDYFHVEKAPLDDKFVRYLSGKDVRYRLGEQRPFWATTAGSKAKEGENFWIEQDILKVHAVYIGTIDGVNVTSDSQEPTMLTRRNTGLRRNRPSQDSIRPYTTYDGLTRMLLIYDRKYEQFTTAPLALGLLYSPLYKAHAALAGGSADDVLEWLSTNKDFDIHGRTLHDRALYSVGRITGNWFKAWARKSAHITNVFDYNHLTRVIAEIIQEGLHLITLQQGQVGWADPQARLDDEIFMLAGCTVPVVLRRQLGNSRYQIIGRAYVDGYMDGKHWETSQRQVRPDGSPAVVTVAIC